MLGISVSRVSLLLAIAILGVGTFLSFQFLVDPFSLPWVNLSEPVAPIEPLNPAQTIEQIKTELSQERLTLGDKLITSTSDIAIYPILDKDTKNIRQIRIYQTLSDSFWQDEKFRKLRLIKQSEVSGLEEQFVKAPAQKYLAKPKKINPKNILPFTELQPIYGDAPTQGTWFMAVGRVDGGVYGQVFAYDPSQLSLDITLEWTNPNSILPEWQRFPTVKNVEPDLVIDQTQNSDPIFLVYRLESTPSTNYPLQFRHLNLHESPSMPKIYNQALVLASVGLWSPALAKLDNLKSNTSESMPWESVIQEQYDLISYHAKITSEQAKKSNSDYGVSSLLLGMDGAWGDALKNLQGSDFGAKIVLEMIDVNGAHLWERINTALQIEPSPEVVMWGSVIVLQRQDLPSAEQWLRSHWKFPNRDISEAISLLQRLDISPLGIVPEQFIGRVKLLGNTLEDKWQIPPPPLLEGQTWYEIDLDLIRDRMVWRNIPFPELEFRSRLIIWKALGLELNNVLSVEISSGNDGSNGEVVSLIAQSIWVGNNGQIRLLAAGSPELGNSLANSSTLNPTLNLAIVKGGDLFIEPRGDFIAFAELDKSVSDRIAATIYAELNALGKVSVNEEEFGQKLLTWNLEQVNLQAKNSKDLILKIDRDTVDLGDRPYPIVMIFDRDGNLLFGQMSQSEPRRWIALLPGSNPLKILIENNGNFESLSLAP